MQGNDTPNAIHGLLECITQLTDEACSHASKTGPSALLYTSALKRRLLAARCLFQLLRTSSISLRGCTSWSGREAADALSGGELMHLLSACRHVSDSLANAAVPSTSNPSAETLFVLFMCLFQVADLRAGTLARGTRGLDDYVLAAPLLGAQILGHPPLTQAFATFLTKAWGHPGARGVACLAFTLLLQAPAVANSPSPHRSKCPVDLHMQQALSHPQQAVDWVQCQQGSHQVPLSPGGGSSLDSLLESTLAMELLSSGLSVGGVSFMSACLASPAVQHSPLSLECFVPLLHDALAELVAVDTRHRRRVFLRSKAEHQQQLSKSGTATSPSRSAEAAPQLSAADDHVEDVAALAALLLRAEPQLAADYWCKHSSLAEQAGQEGDTAPEDHSSILDDTLPSGHSFPVMPSAAILTGSFGAGMRDAVPSFVKVVSLAAARGDSGSMATFVRLMAALATPVTTADNISCVQRAYSFLTPPSNTSTEGDSLLPSADTEWRCDAPVSLRALLGFIAAKIKAFLNELEPADATPSSGWRGGGVQTAPTAAPAGPARLSSQDVELLLAICALLKALCSSPRVRSKLLQAFPTAPRALVTLVKQSLPISAKGALYSALAALARDTGVNGQLWELVEQQQLLASVRREVLDAAAAPRRLPGVGSARAGSSSAWPCAWEQLPDARSPEAFLGSAPLGNDGVLLELNDREASALQYGGTHGFLELLRCLMHGSRGSEEAQAQVAQLSLGLRLPGVGPYMRFVVEHIICSALRRRYDAQRRAEPWQLLATALGIVFDELQAYQVVQQSTRERADEDGDSSIGGGFGATATPTRRSKRAAAVLTPDQLKHIIPGHMAHDFAPQLSAAAAQAHRNACGERASRVVHSAPGLDVSLTGLGPSGSKSQQQTSSGWSSDATAAADSTSVMAPRSAGYGLMYQLLSGGKLLHALLALLLLDGGAAALRHARHSSTPGAAGGDGSHTVAQDFFSAEGKGSLAAEDVKSASSDTVRGAAVHGAPAEMWWRERALTLVLGILHAASCRETAFMAAVRAAERSNSMVGGLQGGKAPPAAPLRPLSRTLCSFGVLPHILRYAAYSASHEPRLALAAARVLARFTAETGVELADAGQLTEQLRLAPELWGAEMYGRLLVGHSAVGDVGSSLGLPTSEHGTVHLCLRWGAADEFAGTASASVGWTPLLQVGGELPKQQDRSAASTRNSRKRSRSGAQESLVVYAPELTRGGRQGDQLRSLTRALASALSDDGGSAADDAKRQLLAVRLLVGQAVGGSSHTDVELAAGDDAGLDALLLSLLVGPDGEDSEAPNATLQSTWGSAAVPGDSFKLMVQAHEADPAAGGWSGPCSSLPTDPSIDLGSGLDMAAVGARALLLQGCGFSTEMQVLSRLLAKQALARQLLEWLRRLVCAGTAGAAGAATPLQALSSTTGGGRAGVPPENMALELLGMGALVRAAKGQTEHLHSHTDLSPVQQVHANRLLRSLLRTVSTRGLPQRRPQLAVAAADLLGCLMNSPLVAPALNSLMNDFQTQEGQIATAQLRRHQRSSLGVDLLQGIADPRPFWSALAWESGVAHKSALHLWAAAAQDDTLAADERAVTEDACLLAGKGALLLGVAHAAANGNAVAAQRAKGLGLSPRDAAHLANIAMDVSEQCSTLAADAVVSRRLLAALLLRGQALEIMMLSQRREAATDNLEQVAPHSLAYALAGLFSPVHVGGQRTTGALQWWGALPLAEPARGASPEGSFATFISDAVALYKQRLEGVNADVGEGVLAEQEHTSQGRNIGALPGSFLAVGSHSVRVLHPQMFRAVLLHGLAGRVLTVPSDLLSGQSGASLGSTARTSIGGGLGSVVGTGWSSHSTLGHRTGPGIGNSGGTITQGLFASNSAPSSSNVQADAVGAMVAMGSAWARTHALRTRAVSATVQLLEAWQGAVTVGLSLGGGTLGAVLSASSSLRGMEGLTPARVLAQSGVGASGADVLAAPVVEPSASEADAVASTCHALLRAVLKGWAGSDSSCLPLPVADCAAGICMGLLWVLRGAGALRSRLGSSMGGGLPGSTAAMEAGAGTGSSPGSLRLSADRSQGLMRDLVTLLCSSGTGFVRCVLQEARPLMGGAPSAAARQRLYCAASQLMQHAAGQSLSPVTRRTLALTAVLSVGGGLSETALLAAAGLSATGQRMKPSAAMAVSWGGMAVPHDRNDCDLASALLSVLPPTNASHNELPVDAAVNLGAVDALGLEARGAWEAVGMLATIPGAAATEGSAVLAALGVLEVPAAPSLLDHFAHTNTANLAGVPPNGAYASTAAWPVPREALSSALDLSAGGIASALVAMGTALVSNAAADSCRGPPVLRATALQSLSEVFAFARRVRSSSPEAPVVAAAAGWMASLRASHSVAGMLDSLQASDKYEASLRGHLASESAASMQALHAQAVAASQAVRSFVGLSNLPQFTELGGGAVQSLPLWGPSSARSPLGVESMASPGAGSRGDALSQLRRDMAASAKQWNRDASHRPSGATTSTVTPATVALVHSETLSALVQLCLAPGGADALLSNDLLGVLTHSKWTAALRDALASAFASEAPAKHTAALLESCFPRLRSVLLMMRVLVTGKSGDAATLGGVRQWLGHHATLLRVVLQMAAKPQPPLCSLVLAAHVLSLMGACLAVPSTADEALDIQVEIAALIDATALHRCAVTLLARFSAQPLAAPYAIAQSGVTAAAAASAHNVGDASERASIEAAQSAVQLQGGIGSWEAPPVQATALHGPCPWWLSITPLTPSEEDMVKRRVALAPMNGLVQTQYASAALTLGHRVLNSVLHYMRQRCALGAARHAHKRALFVPAAASAADEDSAAIAQCIALCMQLGVAARNALETLIALRRIAAVGVSAASSIGDLKAHIKPSGGYGSAGTGGALGVDEASLGLYGHETAPVIVWRALTRAREHARLLTESVEVALLLWYAHAAEDVSGGEVRRSIVAIRPLIEAFSPISDFTQTMLRHLAKLPLA